MFLAEFRWDAVILLCCFSICKCCVCYKPRQRKSPTVWITTWCIGFVLITATRCTILCEETEALSCALWATVAVSVLNGEDNSVPSVGDKPVHMLSIRYCLEPYEIRVKVHSPMHVFQSFNPFTPPKLCDMNLKHLLWGWNMILWNLLDELMAYCGFNRI